MGLACGVLPRRPYKLLASICGLYGFNWLAHLENLFSCISLANRVLVFGSTKPVESEVDLLSLLVFDKVAVLGRWGQDPALQPSHYVQETLGQHSA